MQSGLRPVGGGPGFSATVEHVEADLGADPLDLDEMPALTYPKPLRRGAAPR